MKGKHHSYFKYFLAFFYREKLRMTIRSSVSWSDVHELEPGCTAIIGVCSRLPEVLTANLRCLSSSHWPQLKTVLAVVDGAPDALPAGLESNLIAAFPNLNIRFLHYSPKQVMLAEKLKLPYLYSWMSWCIGIGNVRTKSILLHDYDALILGDTLRNRYLQFTESAAKVQGIAWYKVNGLEIEDKLATTFEAFFDTAWLRKLKPIDLFNKLRIKNGRSIDYDTTLDVQDRLLTLAERQVMAMNEEELVHPLQMIHQFTMFRKQPGGNLPCYSIPMIPFFSYLGGNNKAISVAVAALKGGDILDMNFLGDGTKISLANLTIKQVDWILKQIVQADIALSIAPDCLIYEYGVALYAAIGAAENTVWKGDFSAEQRRWISNSGVADKLTITS